MGIAGSRGRVRSSLGSSAEFNSACDSAYAHCLALTQHAFPGVFPYQLQAASDHIHSSLFANADNTPKLVARWVPHPPSRAQVDSALRLVLKDGAEGGEGVMLGRAQFREWALAVYAEAVVGGAGRAVVERVPVGVVGIIACGAVTRSGKGLVGASLGVYALAVATSVYLGLSG